MAAPRQRSRRPAGATTWDVFERVNSSIEYDLSFYFTNTMLANYRAALQLRSLDYGTPPYPDCR
jgi:hypothetical protein